MKRQGIVIVCGGKHFDEQKIRKILINQLPDVDDSDVIIKTLEESQNAPEILMNNFEGVEKTQEKWFKPISYQQQQKELRFLNKNIRERKK